MAGVLFADSGAVARPAGVKLLALICFGLAAYIFVNGVLVLFGVLSLASGSYILGEYSMMGPAIFLLAAAAIVGLGAGLWRGWNWMRRAAMVAAGLLLATAVMPVSAAVIYFHPLVLATQGAKIIAAIIAIRYLLLPDIADFFSAGR
jgi:hypothetical protein